MRNKLVISTIAYSSEVINVSTLSRNGGIDWNPMCKTYLRSKPVNKCDKLSSYGIYYHLTSLCITATLR